MKEFKPWPYQSLMIDYAIRHPRCGLFVPMGMGKTSAALSIIAWLKDIWGDLPVLVVAPLAVARTTWSTECQKWSNFKDISVSPMLGNTKQRIAGLHKEADVYVINYDNLPWLTNYVKNNKLEWKWKTIIADESTRLKSFRLRQGSQRARALGAVSPYFERFIAMTGTPAPNGLADLWGQVWFIDHGRRLGSSYDAFRSRWFDPERVGKNPHAISWTPKPNADREIHAAISDVCLSIKAEDYFDLEKPRMVTRYVKMDDDAVRIYRDMERKLFIELDSGKEVEALNAGSKTMKLLQIASGAIYTDDKGSWEEVHTAKLDEMESIVNELNGEPVLVAYQFQSDKARILKRFPQAVAFDSTPDMVKRFNEGRIPIMLVHPASAGHGISLQDGSCNLIVFSQWWDLEQYQQVIERIGPMRQIQAGHPRLVTVFNIIAKDTVDERALIAKGNKDLVQRELLEYLRGKYAKDKDN